jgi:hypothetical protein
VPYPRVVAIDTTAALLGAIAAPFGARFLVAWSVELRLRGIVYGANLEPRRRRSDYPSPNDPVRAVLVLLLVSAAGWPIAISVSRLFSLGIVPTFFVSAIASMGYALLRIRADDRRTRDVLAARLASRPSGDIGGH